MAFLVQIALASIFSLAMSTVVKLSCDYTEIGRDENKRIQIFNYEMVLREELETDPMLREHIPSKDYLVVVAYFYHKDLPQTQPVIKFFSTNAPAKNAKRTPADYVDPQFFINLINRGSYAF